VRIRRHRRGLAAAGHHFGGQQSDQQHTNDPTDEVHTDHVE
jgi:hypothetical protein